MKKILVVDDDPGMVDLLRSRLAANQYQIVTASNGEEAELRVEAEKPELIVVDIKMPKMDGWTFVRKVRREEISKNTPIIIMTAYANMQDLFAVEGINDYIVKPFKAEELLEKIKRHEVE